MTKKNIRNKELYMESIKRGSLVGGIIWVCVVIFISINYKTMGESGAALAGSHVGRLYPSGCAPSACRGEKAYDQWHSGFDLNLYPAVYAYVGCYLYSGLGSVYYSAEFFCACGNLGGRLLVSVLHGA